MPTRPQFHQSKFKPARAEERLSSYARGYDAAWRRLRESFLIEHPFCKLCDDFAVLVDHIVPVAVNPALRLVVSNLRSLCTDCHAKVTTNFKLTGRNELPDVRHLHTPAAFVKKQGTTQLLAEA